MLVVISRVIDVIVCNTHILKLINNSIVALDTYDYMQKMTGLSTDYKKKSGPGYKERLNDPNMNYDDMW